ncbi:hypothetical protein M9Y10_035912 [Tritrichomonas musculus]|uniref:Uncharacterized protein n=1 Tax=Tritrichomonas musculus TaxID=1915356 RepID=A0ABR2GVM1_9EUKA
MNYVSSIETLREEFIVPQKFVENDICVREVKIIDTEIENDDLNKETSASATNTIEELISCNDGNKLMHFFNDNCDKETINSVFNRCLSESPYLFLSTCEEGISINNPVAHHKYALYLMKNNDEVDKKTTFEKARNHLKFACKNGFDLSYFLLSRLSHEYFKEDSYAYEIAKEGAIKKEKYSKSLLGHFITHGIGTKKDFQRGISTMLESGADDFNEIFSTDIGIYYINKIEEEKEKKEEMRRKAFECFEKAFNANQTRATINNYGLCFMLGIGTEKNMKKAKEIFLICAYQNDSNSMYHIGFILEETDPEKSLFYYKQAAECGSTHAQLEYAHLLLKQGETKEAARYFKGLLKEAISSQTFRSVSCLRQKIQKNLSNTSKLRQIMVMLKQRKNLLKNHPLKTIQKKHI